MASFEELTEDFAFLPDWEERFRHLIKLGEGLDPLTAAEHNDQNKVRGCASQVWLVTEPGDGKDPPIRFRGDSDALIVRGLIAVLLTLYSGRKASEILNIDARSVLGGLGLDTHLTQQRSNGLFAMVTRIRAEAAQALAMQRA
jgi:cysteine desulfuration protein SufE